MKKRENWKKYRGQFAVLLCILAVLGYFTLQKEGYHMDELLSFELSNAEFNPWIVPVQPVGRLAKFVNEEIRGESFGETLGNLADTVRDAAVNRGGSRLLQYKADVYPEPVWISREQFRDYLTAEGVDRFNYLSVYFNVMDDNHPPLHFMLLHTMSSLFPGIISPLLGCFINLAAVAACILCFFRLGELLQAGKVLPEGYGKPAGICMALLYGLSGGAIATVLLIRMYGVMTAFCVALFSLHVRKWMEGGFASKNRGLAAVTVLGFLTQYFFLFYCLIMAAVTAALLAVRRRYRELKVYIRTMLLCAAAGVVVFPFSIKDVFSSGRGEEALANLGRGFSGYGTRLSAFGSILLKGCFGSVAAGILILLGVALGVAVVRGRRKSDRIKGREREEEGGEEQKGREERKGKRESLALRLMLLVPWAGYFLLAARMSPYLVDRYIMPLFPFGAVILTLLLCRIFAGFQGRNPWWLLLPALILGAVNVACYDGTYLYRGYGEQLQVAGEYAGLPCICVYDGVGYYENLMEFTEYGETLLLQLPELEQRVERESLRGLDRAVVLRKGNVDENAVLEALSSYGLEAEQVLVSESESVYGDMVYLMRGSGFSGE